MATQVTCRENEPVSVGIDASVGDRRCRGPNKVRFKKSFVFYFCLKLYPLSDKQSQILPGRGRCRKVRKSAVYRPNVNQYTISNCSPRCRHSLVLTFIDSDFMSSTVPSTVFLFLRSSRLVL